MKSKLLFSRLDPSIRHFLRRPGISIFQNTYSGFDSEFTNKDIGSNQLVSVQLAVSTKTYLKLPRVRSYQLASLEIKNNLIIPINKGS